jgi:hypothetical protein
MEAIIEEKMLKLMEEEMQQDPNFDITRWNANSTNRREQAFGDILQRALTDKRYKNELITLTDEEMEKARLRLIIDNKLRALFVDGALNHASRRLISKFISAYIDHYTVMNLGNSQEQEQNNVIDGLEQTMRLLAEAPTQDNRRILGTKIIMQFNVFFQTSGLDTLKVFKDVFSELQ